MGNGGCVTCNATLYFGEFILQDMGMHLPEVMPPLLTELVLRCFITCTQGKYTLSLTAASELSSFHVNKAPTSLPSGATMILIID